MRNIILGTAGHIDHGKSSLVKALTGIDPDRLKEEKERGITIDLGFAYLNYPDGLTIGIVDVPGHERLVRNMLAGAAGIDMVLFVIAADEGIMPQSKEHLAICNLLRIKSGLIALNKADLVEPDWLELVKEEIKEFVKGSFLEGAEIIAVSAKTGQNIELLKEKIRDIALKIPRKPSGGAFRLPVDRVFTLKGFGTVVTGTAISGSVKVEHPVEILPSGLKTRIRNMQSHGKPITEGFAGQRLALNLQGIEKEELERGDVVARSDTFRPTRLLNVKIELLGNAPTLKNRSPLHLHIWTSEAIARLILFDREELKPGTYAYAQLRLDRDIVTSAEDRFVIRRISPLDTIGGGVVLDPYPSRKRNPELIDDLSVLEKADLNEKIALKVKRSKGFPKKELYGWINREFKEIENAVRILKEKGEVIEIDGLLFHKASIEKIKKDFIETLKGFHDKNPLKLGIQKEELRTAFGIEQKVFDYIIEKTPEIIRDGEYLRLREFRRGAVDPSLKERILREIKKGAFQPPFKEELAQLINIDTRKLDDILRLLNQEGLLERINDSFYLSKESHIELFKKLKEFFSKKKEMTVADFRDMLQTTRKYAIPLLEYLDSRKITMRVGDVRKLLKLPEA
ncbi:MAG: selenocysteine-specific translation elongation factor [Thermodesulfovibrionales bacterium]